jgi:hypothetical protein
LSGAQKAIDILRKEIDLVMGQIGCPSLDRIGPGFLLQPDAPALRTTERAEPDGAAAIERRRFADKGAR